ASGQPTNGWRSRPVEASIRRSVRAMSGCDPIAMEEMMQSRLVLSMIAGAAVLLLPGMSDPVWAQGAQGGAAAAITGQVTSEAEGGIEGVVVPAKKGGAKVSISAVSHALR